MTPHPSSASGTSGPLSVSVSPTSGYRVRLIITVTSLPGATMTITRDGTPVLGATLIPAESVTINDAEAPLNTPLTYTVEAGGYTVTLTIAGITSDVDVLSQPHRGLYAEIHAESQGEIVYPMPSVLVGLANRRDHVPFWEVERLGRYTLAFRTETRAQQAQVDAVCLSGEPVLLRLRCSDFGDEWLDRDGDRRSSRPSNGRTRIQHLLPVARRLGPPNPGVPAYGDTYADLRAYLGAGATGATLRAAFTNWGQVRATDLQAG